MIVACINLVSKLSIYKHYYFYFSYYTCKYIFSLVLFYLLLASTGFANLPEHQTSSDLKISLVTIGPGETYWERFGHNTLLIEDSYKKTAVTYNYGIFDFEEKDFFFNFIRGIMRYRMTAANAADDLEFYAQQGRWIIKQELNIPELQKAKLRELLEENLRPENQFYNYDYFRNNCSTKIRDTLNQALNDELQKQTIARSRGFSYRMHALRLMRSDLLLMLGMDIGLGPLADQRLSFWNESFIPMQFMSYLRDIDVQDASGKNVPLVEKETLLSTGKLPEPSDYPPDWLWQFLIAGVFLGVFLYFLTKKRNHLFFRMTLFVFSSTCLLILGISGIIMIGLWFLTEHQFAWRNENILLFNPLCLLLLPVWIKSRYENWRPGKFSRSLSLIILLIAAAELFLKALPWFVQDNLHWIALVLPLQAALTRSLWQQSALPSHSEQG